MKMRCNLLFMIFGLLPVGKEALGGNESGPGAMLMRREASHQRKTPPPGAMLRRNVVRHHMSNSSALGDVGLVRVPSDAKMARLESRGPPRPRLQKERSPRTLSREPDARRVALSIPGSGSAFVNRAAAEKREREGEGRLDPVQFWRIQIAETGGFDRHRIVISELQFFDAAIPLTAAGLNVSSSPPGWNGKENIIDGDTATYWSSSYFDGCVPPGHNGTNCVGAGGTYTAGSHTAGVQFGGAGPGKKAEGAEEADGTQVSQLNGAKGPCWVSVEFDTAREVDAFRIFAPGGADMANKINVSSRATESEPWADAWSITGFHEAFENCDPKPCFVLCRSGGCIANPPSAAPTTATPTASPTEAPTATPTVTPTASPTGAPTANAGSSEDKASYSGASRGASGTSAIMGGGVILLLSIMGRREARSTTGGA